MATVVQVIELYRKILDYLLPLEMGFLGWGENGRYLGLDNMRSDDINGRFFYTGLGSGQPLGWFVPEKIRGGWSSRGVGGGGMRTVDGVSDASGVDGVRGVGGVLGGGVNGVEGVRGVGNVRRGNGLSGVGGVLSGDGFNGIGKAGYMLVADDVGSVRGKRGAWSYWSAWNVGNYWNRGMGSTSRALTGANTVSAINGVNAMSAANAANKQNALGYRLGEDLEKQLNGKRILGTNYLAPIDRSLGITWRGFSVIGRIRELLGDQNGFSRKIKTGGTWRTQSAVSENKRLSELERLQNAVSTKKAAASAISGFGEDAGRPAAIRGFIGQESGTAGLGFSGGRDNAGGCDADKLIDTLCGAFREAAFSMSEGVHY